MHAGKIHKALFSVSAITDAVSVAFTLLMLLLLRKDMHFFLLVELLRVLFICLVGCAAAAAGVCAAYIITTEAERVTGFCFFLPRFCPLHCDASDVYFLLLFLAAFIYVI